MMRQVLNLPQKEKGQGLVEYALILVLVAIVVIAVLLTLGPQIGQVFSKVVTVLENTGAISSGVVTGVTANRTGSGSGNDVVVNVTVSTNSSVTITDSQSSQSSTISCNGSCSTTITGVGHLAGTITVTAAEGGSGSAGYPVQ